MISRTIDVELPDCPRCGAKAICVEKGGYGFSTTYVGCSDDACEMHKIERSGGRVSKQTAKGLIEAIANWKKRVANFDAGRSPLVVIEPNNMELTIDLHCPRCREKIVITRVGMDCYHRDFSYPCPYCDEKIDVRLPKWSES